MTSFIPVRQAGVTSYSSLKRNDKPNVTQHIKPRSQDKFFYICEIEKNIKIE